MLARLLSAIPEVCASLPLTLLLPVLGGTGLQGFWLLSYAISRLLGESRKHMTSVPN